MSLDNEGAPGMELDDSIYQQHHLSSLCHTEFSLCQALQHCDAATPRRFSNGEASEQCKSGFIATMMDSKRGSWLVMTGDLGGVFFSFSFVQVDLGSGVMEQMSRVGGRIIRLSFCAMSRSFASLNHNRLT